MTHLYIEQNTGLTEEVNSSIISKLYELAISGDLDETSGLKGRLHSTTGYVSQVNYLNTNFQDLIISCDNLYIEFQDPTVASILATYFGDGTGITQATVNSITSFNGKFNGSSIVTFNELSQFPNITEINNNNRFNDCSSLTSIDLKNITKVSGKDGYQRWNFESCTSLTNIGDTSNITYVGFNAFYQCPLQGEIDFSNVEEFGSACLYQTTTTEAQCDLSQCTIDNTKVKFIGNGAFNRCSSFSALQTINFPNLESVSPTDGITSMLQNSFNDCTQIEHVVDLGKITIIGNLSSEGCFNRCNNLLDVTLPETLTTVRVSAIGSRPKLKYVKILSTSLPEYNRLNVFGNTSVYGTAFGEAYRNNDVTNDYQGSTYPIYVRDDLLTQYQAADGWKYVGPNRLKPLSQFATDFPNG